MKNPRVLAQAINLDHSTLLLAGYALMLALFALLAFAPAAHAADCKEAQVSAQEEIILPPYELKSQKLGH